MRDVLKQPTVVDRIPAGQRFLFNLSSYGFEDPQPDIQSSESE